MDHGIGKSSVCNTTRAGPGHTVLFPLDNMLSVSAWLRDTFTAWQFGTALVVNLLIRDELHAHAANANSWKCHSAWLVPVLCSLPRFESWMVETCYACCHDHDVHLDYF